MQFVGFAFHSAVGQLTSEPPFEDTLAVPPTLGASLNTVVRFLFDGVPAGPFSATSLPVFTTPADISSELSVPGGASLLLAKGSYALLVDQGAGLFAVEFTPFVPTSPLDASGASGQAAVPGLLPGSVYTARVSTQLTSMITNLSGPGGELQFGTTSNPAAYFPADVADDDPPAVVALSPPDGTAGFYPGLFSNLALGATAMTFPEGPADILVTFDRPVVPTTANLLGQDITGDGLDEPTFFLRTRGTPLLVSHTVPANALGSHGSFAALSALTEGSAPPVDGSALIVHGGSVPGATAAFSTTPTSLAVGEDPALLFAILPVPGGNDRLTVFDHLSGDPSFAALSGNAPGGLDTGLDDATGLHTLVDGRLVVFDRSTRRLVELRPSLVRSRPSFGNPNPGPPQLLTLTVGDGLLGGNGAFASQPFPLTGSTVLDIAQAPSGELYALMRDSGASFTRLQPLHSVDLDGNGFFEALDGLPNDDAPALSLPGDYDDVVFLSETELLALDRGRDQIDRLELNSGLATLAVPALAAFGFPLSSLPGQQSPATALACGFLDLDVEIALQSNGPEGAVLHVQPAGLLPVGAEVTLMQRNTFASLFGTSAVNADLAQPQVPSGALALITVTTATPQEGLNALIDDLFLEQFSSAEFEDSSPNGLSPSAHWGSFSGAGVSNAGLRASVGVSAVGNLGDFLPLALAGFDESLLRYQPTSSALGDQALNTNVLVFKTVLLDTDSQTFPLPDGSTPGATQVQTVLGGQFAFHDFIIPAGVHVVVRGSRPLRIVATGRVQIDGLLDVSGSPGFTDDSFNSGFIPVPGGAGGPGGGRGGDGHPTLFAPLGSGAINQYVTPETGQRGQGPVPSASGTIQFQEVGGYGGLSTLGYNPNLQGQPKLSDAANDEHQRPPGGGGGSFFARGDRSHEGAGVYLVQSSSSWFPFTMCPTNDKVHDALYGNDENFWAGASPSTPLQCVYLVGTPGDPERFKPGAAPGDEVFGDADPSNNFIGPGGEVSVLIGGQGGGGGGSRVDSMRHKIWSMNNKGSPMPSPPAPPYYPKLVQGIFVSPTVFDAKGGGGGGGAGSLHIRSFGDITVGRLGYIDASGGDGGGGELVGNSTFVGGGGGGSGGAVLLEAAGSIRFLADPGHRAAGFTDQDGEQGAAVNVSGGMGRDTRASSSAVGGFSGFGYEASRSDGGQGGFGLIQLQVGDGSGVAQIDEGAYLFARKRTMLKEGAWTGKSVKQEENDAWSALGTGDPPPDSLRYIDMLHWRQFEVEGSGGLRFNSYTLNGSYPPIIPSVDGDNGSGLSHEWPEGSGQFWADTAMTVSAYSNNQPVVREPQPEFLMKSYLGWDPITFLEPFHQQGPAPGEVYDAADVIPLAIAVAEPDGTPFLLDIGGQQVFDPAHTIDRLPLVHPSLTPPTIGSKSVGTSRWLNFQGMSLRPREGSGRPPPFFEAFHGTFNAEGGAFVEPIPPGSEGTVRVGAPVPGNDPGHFVVNGGYDDPGLFPGQPVGVGTPPNPPFNDIKVDAPDLSVPLPNVLTDNASVEVLFQGAYGLRAGSQLPDPETMSPWTADLTDLTGMPLVRFSVRFDLNHAPAQLPFGSGSLRPLVDMLRLRIRY
ncbi:MAG: hypothetical protein ACI9EF_000494 [Pseudohongiellaceae bacterium]